MSYEEDIRRMKMLSSFVDQLEQSLTPAFGEVFSDETRNLRNVLLALALVLILISTGVVKLSEGTFSVGDATVTLTANASLLFACALVVFFFVVAYLCRCYMDWRLWQLKQLKAQTVRQQIHLDLLHSYQTRKDLKDAILEDLVALIKAGSYGIKTTELSEKLENISHGEEATSWQLQSELFTSLLAPIVVIRRIRLGLEVVFPTLLALFSVFVAVAR